MAVSTPLHRAVLRTRHWPGLGALYRGIYSAGVEVCAKGFYALGGFSAVYLHRGMTSASWEAGVSDIDLILLRSNGKGPADEKYFLARLSSRLRMLKKLFPMLGDLWIGDKDELDCYLRWGGLRAWEDPPRWRKLLGEPIAVPALAESPEKKRRFDPWVWAFVSHMEVSRRFFHPTGPPEKNESDLRKIFLDACRFSLYAGAKEEAPDGLLSRDEARSRFPQADDKSPKELWLESVMFLAEASREVLKRLAGPETGPTPFPQKVDSDSWMHDLKKSSGALAVVSDQPYHTYLILPEKADLNDFSRAAESLLAEPPPGVALVVTPDTWALLLQSSYLGAPLGWLESTAPRDSAPSGPFAGWETRALGELAEIPLLPPRLRWEIAAEAASWMALWWRYLWIAPGWLNRFVLYHLYTRALGLRLMLLETPSGPFSDWGGLIARSARSLPDQNLFWESLAQFFRAEPEPCLGGTARSALASEHLEALNKIIGEFTPLCSRR